MPLLLCLFGGFQVLINSLVCWFCKANCFLVSQSSFRTGKQISNLVVPSEWWPRFPSLFSSSVVPDTCTFASCPPCGTILWALGWEGRLTEAASVVVVCWTEVHSSPHCSRYLPIHPSIKGHTMGEQSHFGCALCLNLDFLAWTSCCRPSYVLITFLTGLTGR